VWTGSELIVWGGYDGTGFRGDGAAYDPVTDTWRALPSLGAPEARSAHTAVWTGQRMIVHGGQGAFVGPAPNSIDRVFDDGASYDPIANTWTPIAPCSAGGVQARRNHLALWTGSRMVVWGGRDAFALTISTVDTGGVYDPALDTWTPTSTTRAPGRRWQHTAVWSGGDVLVWGGQEAFSTFLGDGGAYSPPSDAWSAVPLAGAPSARQGHVAVWTGQEMVVWGGATSGGETDTGAAFDPAAGTWRAASSAQAPAARSGHTAVWTGAYMLVWGGRAGSVLLASGGAYAP
jgi:N-acetylneuraminic acid mutarotase